MWLLENDGDVFLGKRLWLRPGKKYIFGRTSVDAGGFVIENKTISRKHLTVEIGSVKPGDSAMPGTRSQIILQDLGTKMGTWLDGNQIRGQQCTPTGDQHEIRLGQYEKLFRITWYPAILSFSLTDKELKSNPLPNLYEKLGSLDIKVLVEYSREFTTHVVAKKRNTSKGLQALINGKYIVDYTFIDAIATATRTQSNEVSPLEADFDSNWPNELDYLPPRGTEPTQRSPDAYAPDSRRQDVFEGYTFIFCNQVQFENLLAPITNGGGKALLRQVDQSASEIPNFVGYVKNVAGEKGLGEFEDGSEGRGVVVVKYQPVKGPTSDWYAAFGRQVALQLDHRLIEQKEFLDAILNNDASILRKPLELEQPSGVTPSPTADYVALPPELRAPLPTLGLNREDKTNEEVPSGLVSVITAPDRKVGRSRRTVTSRFKGFDDDFDTAAISSEAKVTNLATSALPQALVSDLFVSPVKDMDIYQLGDDRLERDPRSSRKRPLPPQIEDEDEADLLTQIAPAAANLKRRRLADGIERKRRGEMTPSPPPPPPPLQSYAESNHKLPKSKPRVKITIDVLEIARQRHEQEEVTARAEREALREAMNDTDIDINQVRKLAIVEGMEVTRSIPPPTTSKYREDSERWDELWNGRKNFKKFRRNGESGSKSSNKVIVPLEEARRKDFGIGDEYWLNENKDIQTKRKFKRRNPETQTMNDSQPQLSEDGNQVEKTFVAANRETAVLSSRFNRLQSQKLPSGRTPKNKRGPPSEPVAKSAPAKKLKQSTLDGSDESEDGLGFRFGRK